MLVERSRLGRDARVGTWAKASNVEIAYTPTNASWLNRIEAQFTALTCGSAYPRQARPPRPAASSPPIC
jgi:hypothetical protein